MSRSVYAIKSDAGPVKIGISKCPASRLNSLLLQQPFGAELVHVLKAESSIARAIEDAAHQLLAAKQLRGEWFDVDVGEAISAIAEAAALVESGRYVKQRPPAKEQDRMQLVLPRSLSERIDEWRSKRRPIPNRSEAIRMMVEECLRRDAKDAD